MSLPGKINWSVRGGVIALRFDEKLLFSTVLGFTAGWDYKHYKENISGKLLNLGKRDKIHLKRVIIDGSVRDAKRQPKRFSFILDRPLGYKDFHQPQTIHDEKVTESVLNTKTFYLEEDNNEEVDFNKERLCSTLQMIKI